MNAVKSLFNAPFLTFVLLTAVIVSAPSCIAQNLSPDESIKQMKTADGFQLQVVAGEPLVRQPVAIEFDDRGRLWVIQYLQYPNPAGLKRIKVDRYSRTKYDRVPKPPPHGPRGADRITILSDADGDGRMDSGTDFVAGLNLATGLAFGHGGVFVLNVPYLLFYPDRDRNDVPDSDPEVLLTGFGMEDAHSVANSLTWGPDGWLYGCQGSTVTANIRGHEFQQGVWRYHPVTRKFELFCEGGGNSWGLDFDRQGNLFYSTNYGNFILLHGVQGGYFVKSFAKHGALHNAHTYGYFNHAPHQDFRGGHVTVGGIVYQGNSFPDSFRGKYIAADLLGHGVYWHELKPLGSTFQTVHGGELLQSSDSWFAPTDVTMGPDGAIYVSDWHDARTAHPDPDANWDRTNGRIIRIASKGTKPAVAIDFAQLSSDELLRMHEHKSQWYVRRARQEFARRRLTRTQPQEALLAAIAILRGKAESAKVESDALEAMWTLAVIGEFDEGLAEQLLDSVHAAVRSWTVRLLGDAASISDATAHRLDKLAEEENSVLVRQQLACTARRLPAHQAVPVINANINRDIDNLDTYMPLLWWWAVEQHSVDGREEVLRRFVRPSLWKSNLGRNFLLTRLLRRYAAEATDDGLTSIVTLLKAAPDSDFRQPLWSAILKGWDEQEPVDARTFRSVAVRHEFSAIVRQSWAESPNDPELTRLAVLLNHRPARELAQQIAFDSTAEQQHRIAMLNLLSSTHDLKIVGPALLLIRSAQPDEVRRASIRILAGFEDHSVAVELVALLKQPWLSQFHEQIVGILLSRKSSAIVLMAAVEDDSISADSIGLEQIRRVLLFQDKSLNKTVAKHWGQFQAQSAGEKLAEVRRLNNDLRAGVGNSAAGKLLFRKHCAGCHTLFDEGEKIGPDLTTANRKDTNYLLVSLVDPDSVIRKEYVSLIVHTVDGRVLTGLPVRRDSTGITLADGKKKLVQIASSNIQEIHQSPVSLMPGNLYREFNPQELRDMFRYLQSNGVE